MTTTIPRTVDQAIASVAYQHDHGPRFEGPNLGAGQCKKRTRLAYGVPSDGSNDAAEAWTLTDHRIQATPATAPRGSLAWWTGGSEGHGHVTIMDGHGGTHTVDQDRPGFWNHCAFSAIANWAPRLKFAGFSLDIDGVLVVPPAHAASVVVEHDERGTRARNLWREKGLVSTTLLSQVRKSGSQPGATAIAEHLPAIKAAMQNIYPALIGTGDDVTRSRNLWREHGVIDTQLLSKIRKSGHQPAATAIAANVPHIESAMQAIYAAFGGVS